MTISKRFVIQCDRIELRYINGFAECTSVKCTKMRSLHRFYSTNRKKEKKTKNGEMNRETRETIAASAKTGQKPNLST